MLAPQTEAVYGLGGGTNVLPGLPAAKALPEASQTRADETRAAAKMRLGCGMAFSPDGGAVGGVEPLIVPSGGLVNGLRFREEPERPCPCGQGRVVPRS